jgi:hypothetical protein
VQASAYTRTITGRAHDIKTVVLVGTSCALIHHAHIATVQSSTPGSSKTHMPCCLYGAMTLIAFIGN